MFKLSAELLILKVHQSSDLRRFPKTFKYIQIVVFLRGIKCISKAFSALKRSFGKLTFGRERLSEVFQLDQHLMIKLLINFQLIFSISLTLAIADPTFPRYKDTNRCYCKYEKCYAQS